MTCVTAMLAWYDEPPELLAQAVASAAVLADKVVAVDGGYRLRPGAAACSPAEQADAIRSAAGDAGLAIEVLVPGRVWEGQVEKRDWMLRHAAALADWVVPLDADWVFVGDREEVRAEIEGEEEVALFVVSMWTPYDGSRDLGEVAATSWHYDLAGCWLPIDVLMRAVPEMRVEKHHWWYSGLWAGGRKAFWGCDGVYPYAPRRKLAPLTIEHRCFDRDLERIDANRVFCEARDRQVASSGVEA